MSQGKGAAYWGGSAGVGAALAVLFWILQGTGDAGNHAAYLAAAIVCTVLAVAFAIVAIVIAAKN